MIHALCRPIMLFGAGGRRYWTAFFTSACFMFVTVINGRRLVRMIAPRSMRADVRNDRYAEYIGASAVCPIPGATRRPTGRCSRPGLPRIFDCVATSLGLAPNTLSSHFDRLRQAGLISARREGRSLI
jgi:DNA-binding transcriptional ArsR family regulator